MNSDFAGSSSHDDRRRRRLLSEQTLSDENAAVVFTPSRVESSRNHRYPVKRIIHYRVWKNWMMSFLLLVIGGGLLYGAWSEQHYNLGNGFSFVFNAETGRIFSVVGAGLLFLSGQLAWLIGWARSRSLTDYSGRYRVWRYVGLFLFVLSFGVLIGADRVLNESLAFANFRMPWSEASWNWMIPTGVISLILVWVCDREMRWSKLGRTHLWSAVGLVSAGLGLPFFSQLNLPVLVEQGLLLGGLICLMMSLRWFARHVIYVSAEPVSQASHPGLFSRVFMFWKQRRMEKAAARKKKKSTADGKKQSEKKSSTHPLTDSKSNAPRRRGSRKRAEIPQEADFKDPTDDGRSSTDEAPANEDIRIVKLNAEELSVSEVDEELIRERIEMMELLASEGEPFDLDILKGLTKKQKKRLRNYWRELERSYQIRRAG